jgi:hypothetical protein
MHLLGKNKIVNQQLKNLVSVCLLLLLCEPISSEVYTWKSGVRGDWIDKQNWYDPGGKNGFIPGPGDEAYVTGVLLFLTCKCDFLPSRRISEWSRCSNRACGCPKNHYWWSTRLCFLTQVLKNPFCFLLTLQYLVSTRNRSFLYFNRSGWSPPS